MMITRISVCLLLLLFCASSAEAQKIKRVRGEYTYHAPENVTLEEAKRTAFERAKIQAIADEFGTIVSQSNTTVVSNVNGKSTSDFVSLGGSDVKGEWIETIGEPKYEIVYEQGMLVVCIIVEGRIREIVNAGVEFEAAVLRNGTELRFKDSEFHSGDDLFLYFKAPIDGHLAVYFLDETTTEVFCLLPYRNSGEGTYCIKHDKPYIFFSEEKAEGTKSEIDEYTLTTTRSRENYILYLVFSPNEFVKANVKDNTSVTLPRQLSYQDFKKWLAKLQTKDNNAKVESIKISITQ